MAPYTKTNSISELMPAAELTKLSLDKRPYTTLPVVVLALRVLKKMAILLVTDFTSHPDLGFAKGNLPSFLPKDFVIGTKRIENSQVLAVGLPSNRAQYVWQSFECPDLKNGDYDFHHEDKCDILGLCIIMRLNFKSQTFKNGLEGFFGHIYPWDHGILEEDHSQNHKEDEVFQGFMDRLAQRMDPDLYTQLSHRMPLEKYIPIPETPAQDMDLTADASSSTVGGLNPVNVEISSTGTKKRRLDPRDAIYQQQFTQATQPNGQAHISNMLLLSEAQKSAMLQEYTQNTQLPSALPNTPKPKVWNLRNNVDFDVLYGIECHQIPERTCFVTNAVVAGIEPHPEFVFVKPFGRTLKISPIRFLLQESQKYISVEASVEEDLCQFFGIPEVEVAIHHVYDFVTALKMVAGRKLEISLEKRTRILASGHEHPYWGISSSLRSLYEQISYET